MVVRHLRAQIFVAMLMNAYRHGCGYRKEKIRGVVVGFLNIKLNNIKTKLNGLFKPSALFSSLRPAASR